jgi:hypothetical protein
VQKWGCDQKCCDGWDVDTLLEMKLKMNSKSEIGGRQNPKRRRREEKKRKEE